MNAAAASNARAMKSPWAAYVPSAKAPWNLRRVVHLHHRAGFAATCSENQRDLADGPEASITRLLKGTARSRGVPGNFEETAAFLADAAVASQDPLRLKAWWVYRMLFGPDPLGERLTLLWHNHFATSNAKVQDLAAMRRQNEVFRKHARAPFGKLLAEAVRDPALLIWLDAPSNRKGHANENLARELMELFTLGIGNYSESDVKEAARALTGWTVGDGGFQQELSRHDGGEKTILGRRGRANGDDLLRMLLEQPATGRRLAGRICEMFFGEKALPPSAVDALADGLRKHDLDIGWAVETVLRSEAFFAPANLGCRVRGPVEHLIGAVRALELLDPAPATIVLAEWAARLGQDLFYPPNVGGWAGGREWINPRSILARRHFAVRLAEGEPLGLAAAPDFRALAQRHGRAADRQSQLSFFADLLLGGAPSPEWREGIVAALGNTDTPAEQARQLVALVLASTAYQLS